MSEAIVKNHPMNGGRWARNSWWTAVLLLFCQVAMGAPQEYELQGIITRTIAAESTTHWCNFSIAVSGPKSIITVVYFNGEYFVCGTDGEDSYLLNEMRPARAKDAEDLQFGGITSGPLSVQASAPIQLTWIAYASSAHLAGKKKTIPLESFREMNKFLSNEIDQCEDAPCLPKRIEWSHPGRYPAGIYTAEGMTNHLGATIPMSWRFDFHGPGGKIMDVLKGTVTNLSPRKYEGSFLPKLEGNVRITEWRLEPEIGMAFDVPVVDDDWPRKDDPELQRMWRIYRASYQKTKAKEGRKSALVIMAFVVVTGLALVIGGVIVLRRCRTVI